MQARWRPQLVRTCFLKNAETDHKYRKNKYRGSHFSRIYGVLNSSGWERNGQRDQANCGTEVVSDQNKADRTQADPERCSLAR